MPAFNLDDYVQVNERLEKFRADHPTWGLETELIYRADDRFIVRAAVSDDGGRIVATGMAEEIRGTSMVNKTSPLENCETSAWGRALACLGYDVKRAIASREEMEKATSSAPAPAAEAITDDHAQLVEKVKDLSPANRKALQAWMVEQKMSSKIAELDIDTIAKITNKIVDEGWLQKAETPAS